MSVTIEEINKLSEEISILRTTESKIKYGLKQVTDQLDIAETKMMQYLEENQLQRYSSPVGMFSLAQYTSVKTPKTPEDKEKFYTYLKEKGLYENMVSVNSQTLNSFFKEELAMAEQTNEGVDPATLIPGLTEVTLTPRLSFRK